MNAPLFHTVTSVDEGGNLVSSRCVICGEEGSTHLPKRTGKMSKQDFQIQSRATVFLYVAWTDWGSLFLHVKCHLDAIASVASETSCCTNYVYINIYG